MTATTNLDTGRLWLSPAGVEALLLFADGNPDCVRHPGYPELESTGVVRATYDGRHPTLARLVGAIGNPELVELELSYDERAAHVWADAQTAAVALPARGEGQHQLLPMHVSLVPLVLARLVDLRPMSGPDDGAADEPEPGDVKRRWTLTGRWTDDGRVRGASLTVLDAAHGWWRVDRVDGQEMSTRTTSTAIIRAMGRMIMRQDDR